MALVAVGLWVLAWGMALWGTNGGPSWPSIESMIRAMALGATLVWVTLVRTVPIEEAYDEGRADERAGGRRASDHERQPTTAELRIIRGGQA